VRATFTGSPTSGQDQLAHLPTASGDLVLAERLEGIAKTIEQLQAPAILKIAERLTEARGLFRYHRNEGGFGGWVETRLRCSRQTAYNLLHVYEQFGSGESVKYLDSFPAPSTPEAARIEIIERAETGETVSHAEVKNVVKNARAKSAVTGPQRHWPDERRRGRAPARPNR
jgi:hypothetical protein